MVETIFFLCPETSRLYNLNIQFPLCTKSLRNVAGVALNISVHQNCVIFIVPPNGHRKSDKHHLIDMMFTACFLLIMTCT